MSSSSSLRKFSSTLGQTFQNGHTPWFDRSYLLDWTIAVTLYVVGGIIDDMKPFERVYSLEDPSIKYPHRQPQQVSSFANNVAATGIPLAFILVSAVLNISIIELHHGALGLFFSRALCRTITEFLKNRVGRLRPDFLARCEWSEAAKRCTGDLEDIIDGHKSFPSGHSSTIFAGMGFLFFWLAGKTAAWCFSEPLPPRSILSSRLGRITLTLIPLMIGSWVAITRLEDYRHHKEDVIVGSLIGMLTSSIGYFAYWPNPFSAKNYEEGTMGKPKVLYRDDEMFANNNGYRGMTGLEEDERLPV